ncbi:hypothetical protein E2C01_035670 [Portunus trituberculatus]|uniref:Uncharacterized protein n=1 Tax=Portunus trituberculatus TaxID=210409 RepID=A0A5B7F925_PORTR|nr:hypothetical protein [Portunus trituberculatus]
MVSVIEVFQTSGHNRSSRPERSPAGVRRKGANAGAVLGVIRGTAVGGCWLADWLVGLLAICCYQPFSLATATLCLLSAGGQINEMQSFGPHTTSGNRSIAACNARFTSKRHAKPPDFVTKPDSPSQSIFKPPRRS